MKKGLGIIKKIVLTLVFLAILFVCLYFVMRIPERKDSREKYSDFFEYADDIDVLLLGSSHVINGINPIILYEESGITSYNMGGHGSPVKATYWELMNALDYSSPSVVVVDAYMLEKNYDYIDVMDENASEDEVESSIQQLHLNMDVFSPSLTKLRAIKDLVSSNEVRSQFIFPFQIYHDRWRELEENDFLVLTGDDKKNEYMGFEATTDVFAGVEEYEQTTEGLSDSTVGTSYLWKILEECNSRGIDVIVTYLPFYATYEDQMASHTAGLIADELGARYINFNELEGGDLIDYEFDLADHGHLNITGAEKVSRYLADVLAEYSLTDHRGDERYSYWDERVSAYHKEYESTMLKSDNLYATLNLYANADKGEIEYPNIILYIRKDSAFLSDAYINKFIENISIAGGANALSTRVEDAFMDKASVIMICDDDMSNATVACGDDELSFSSSIGELSLISSEYYKNLYPGGNTEYNLLNMVENYETDVQVLFYNKDGDIKRLNFDYDFSVYNYSY